MNGVITINLAALAQNYRLFQDKVGRGCAVSAVVKANAYGCGLSACAEKLYQSGARHFFVATLPEALELRSIIAPDAAIYMLGGFLPDCASYYRDDSIIPLLNDMSALHAYSAMAREAQEKWPAILHIDTGMNRLGLSAEDVKDLADQPVLFTPLDIHCIMSHLVSAEETANPLSALQKERFDRASQRLESLPLKAPKSLANSSGIFLGASYHYNMVRPGMALYGLNPVPDQANPMQRVVEVNLPVLQVRSVKKGESCGYNETYRFDKDARLATLSGGYADGILRSGSNAVRLYWKDYPCALRGRVSMDTIIVDISDVPESEVPVPGDMFELIGPHQSADALATQCGTIGYEILTSLSRRFTRRYIG